MKTKIIFVHGVEHQSTNYANKLALSIGQHTKVDFDSIIWCDSIAGQMLAYLQAAYAKPNIFWDRFKSKIDPLALQILAYEKNKNKDSSILADFNSDFRRASKGYDHIVLVAHSLGSVIAFDYLFGFREFKVDPKIKVDFVTMGSPLLLWKFAMGKDGPLERPENVLSWININSPRDGIGNDLTASELPITRHYEIKTKFLPIRAHTGYWKNKKVAEIIARVV